MLTSNNNSSKTINTNNINNKSQLTTENAAIVAVSIGAAAYVLKDPLSMITSRIVTPKQS